MPADAWAPSDAGSEGSGDEAVIPPMQQPLDVNMRKPEEVQDLKIVTREYPDGQGKLEVLHNSALSRSLMTGTFESTTTSGGKVVYEGTFLNDPHSERPTPHGQGRRVNVDGSTYTGQWKDGFPDGNGEWRAPPQESATVESFVGEWKAGKRHGFGLYKFANGDMYEGDWCKGRFVDRGKYVYANGDEFSGIWEDGVKKNGSFYFKDGRISRRVWERGVLVSCQDFDGRKRSYVPTITRDEIHEPSRNAYGAKASTGMFSPRGVKM